MTANVDAPQLRVAPPRTVRTGCLVSILVCVVGFLGAAGLIIAGIIQLAAGVAELPNMPVGETRTVELPGPGTYFLYYTTGDRSPGGLTAEDPAVSITGPSGDAVPVIPNHDTGGGSVGGYEARLFARFLAPTAGEYAVRSSTPPGGVGADLTVRLADEPVDSDLTFYVLGALIVGSAFGLAALALAVAWPLRRLIQARIGSGAAPASPPLPPEAT